MKRNALLTLSVLSLTLAIGCGDKPAESSSTSATQPAKPAATEEVKQAVSKATEEVVAHRPDIVLLQDAAPQQVREISHRLYGNQGSFASYGTPNGSCGSFATGFCHAINSMSVVSNYVIGNSSVVIPASNGVFGDPCGGTYKRLYVTVNYGPSGSVPSKLFTCANSCLVPSRLARIAFLGMSMDMCFIEQI